MKRLYFLLLGILSLGSVSFSQCDAPELVSWNYPNDSTLLIEFTVSEDVFTYELELFLLDDTNLSQTKTGEAFPGLNTVTIYLSEISDPWSGFPFNHSYCSGILTGFCENESNASDEFYVSDMSLLNEGICPNVSVLNQWIPDIVDGSVETTFQLTNSETPFEIEDFALFIDLTHSYLGDLDIKLTSPSGTTINLMSYPNGFGNSQNMSVLFDNDANNLNLTTLDDGFSTLRGVYSPEDSFEAFNGELINGTWILTFTDNIALDNGYLCGICPLVESAECESTAAGIAFYDYNDNGIQDAGEPPFSHHIFNTSQQNTLITNADGEFANCFEYGQLDISFNNIPLYHTLSPEDGYNITLESGDYLEDLDFRLVPIPGMNDLVVDVYSTIPDVPGFETTYYISASNVGTECIEDIVLTFTSPEGVDILSVNDTEDDIISPQEFVLEIGTLCPQESDLVQTIVSISEDIEMGVSNFYTASLASPSSDETPENNTITVESIVVAAFDPNDKMVNHEVVYADFMEDQKKLTYTVRFQNDGTFHAENVVIKDSIQDGLILESFQLLESSHNVIPQINGNILNFNFIGIQLPQSDLGLEESQGYVRFSFLPTESFSLDETIENTAGIYFDFNEPIITNTAVTLYDEVEIVDSVLELESGEILIYPNPTEDYITVNTNGQFSNSTVRILDLTGRTLIDNSSEDSRIDVTSLETGVFLIRITSETGKTVTSSFIKK